MQPISLFFFCLLILSCQKEELSELNQTPYENIPDELSDYFALFEKEALVAGISLGTALSEVTGEIADINREHVAGVCTYSSQTPNHIRIDRDFWNSASSSNREFVVFHELGHCVLNRAHVESQFENGICKSMMRSGVGNCRDAYSAENRSYYLEELFSDRDTWVQY